MIRYCVSTQAYLIETIPRLIQVKVRRFPRANNVPTQPVLKGLHRAEGTDPSFLHLKSPYCGLGPVSQPLP
jgi:hypothetical protein